MFEMRCERHCYRSVHQDDQGKWVPAEILGCRTVTASRQQSEAARCEEIVRNIEEALFARPPEPYEELEQQVPVNGVVFLDRP
jgi:hypothetical protein